eukprot:m.824161 g.824161  ORF g.824161 m.824161 type:complete len:789 (+) comp59404_c0_seq8:1758-4124(+)
MLITCLIGAPFRGFLQLVLLVLCILIILTSVGLLKGSKQFASGMTESEDACYDALNGIYEYKANVTTELVDLVNDQMVVVQNNTLLQFDAISTTRTSLIQPALQSVADATTTLMRTLSTMIDICQSNVAVVNNNRNTIISQAVALSAAMSTFTSNSNSARSACIALEPSISGARRPTFDSYCQSYPTSSITLGINYGSLNDLGAYSIALTQLQNSNMTAQIVSANATFANLSSLVTQQLIYSRASLGTSFSGYQSVLTVKLSDFVVQLNSYFPEFFNLTEFAEKVENSFHGQYGSTVETYQSVISISLAIGSLMVASVLLLGLAAGFFGSSTQTDPRARSSTAMYGALLLLIGILLATCMAISTNVFTGLYFYYGSVYSKTCDVFQTDRFITDVLDNPSNFEGRPLLEPWTFSNITVLEVVDSCRQNASLYSAARLDSRFNLTDTFDSSTTINITNLLNQIPLLSGRAIVPQAAYDIAETFRDTDLGAINFAPYITQASVALTSPDLSALQTTVNAILNNLVAFQSLENPSGLSTLITDTQTLLTLINGCVTSGNTINALRSQQLTSIAGLQATIPFINSNVSSFTTAADQLEVQKQQAVSNALELPAAKISLEASLQEDIAGVVSSVKADYAKCQYGTDLYDNVVKATCVTTMDGAHAAWFSLALLSLFLILAIPVSLKLVKFFDRLIANYKRPAPRPVSAVSQASNQALLSYHLKPYHSNNPSRTSFSTDSRPTSARTSVISLPDEGLEWRRASKISMNERRESMQMTRMSAGYMNTDPMPLNSLE